MRDRFYANFRLSFPRGACGQKVVVGRSAGASSFRSYVFKRVRCFWPDRPAGAHMRLSLPNGHGRGLRRKENCILSVLRWKILHTILSLVPPIQRSRTMSAGTPHVCRKKALSYILYTPSGKQREKEKMKRLLLVLDTAFVAATPFCLTAIVSRLFPRSLALPSQKLADPPACLRTTTNTTERRRRRGEAGEEEISSLSGRR